MRAVGIILASLLFVACAPPTLPAPPPTPDPAAPFRAAYADVTATYETIAAEMARPDLDAAFADPAFRERVQTLAADWRKASNDLRYLEQPAGAEWEQAWPRIVDAMEEYAYVASVMESAARENNPFLLLPATGKLDAAAALLSDAMGILEGE